MTTLSHLSAVASLIADQTRVAMLVTLMDGRAHPAGDLAQAAGVTPQTASAHLGKLLDGGLVLVEVRGRHRYYRISGDRVATAIEQLAALGPIENTHGVSVSRDRRQLRFCRRCYDHMAGQLGVLVTDEMQRRGYLVPGADDQFVVSDDGHAWFACFGINVAAIRPTRRGLARQCLDWTERRHHLAGPLGVRFLATLCENGWMQRSGTSRAIVVTSLGWSGLEDALGITRGMLQ